MGALDDYLNALAVRPERGFGGLGTTPFTPALIGPIRIPSLPPALIQSVVGIYSQPDRAAVDAQMWQLDSRWLGSASWADMRLCVVGRGDVSGGTVASPYRGAGTCRTPTGAEAQPTCLWGFWRIDRCDLDTAGTLAFQYPRYLWAQSRMRDLLANKPVPGRVNDDVAAAWAWNAAQLISVLLWSTNVRWDNPNSTVSGSYVAGMLAPARADFGVPYDGPALSGTPYYYGRTMLFPRVLNSPGYTRVAPTRQIDFNPGNGPLPFMYRPADQPRSAQPDVVYRGFQYNGVDYRSDLPLGLTPEQTQQIKTLAYSYASASGDADALRWASTKAFNDYWFRITWSWPMAWRSIPGLTYHGQPVVIGSARVTIEDLARQLAWYSNPTLTYVAWMQQAMRAYSLDTAFLGGNPSPAAQDFVRAREALTSSVNNAASTLEATVRAGTTGTDATASMVTSLTAALVQQVFTLVAQSVPVLGALLTFLQQLQQYIVGWAGGAIGNVPCPAFPFLRVMAPSSGGCDLSTEQITSSILGIDSRASWPVSIDGQTRSFSVDGKSFPVIFDAADTTADLVARRINSAAALVALPSVASVRSGQVHVEGRDGVNPARATGGTACALGFPGPCSTPSATPGPTPGPSMITCPNGIQIPAGTDCPPTPAKSSPIPLLVGAAIALRFLLG